MKTQIGIIGAGPAGLLLARILSLSGIESVILEKRTSEHVASRIRAGILEPNSVKLLKNSMISKRLEKEGLNHKGFHISFENHMNYINLFNLTNCGEVTVYGQTEITKDLMNDLDSLNTTVYYDVSKLKIVDLESRNPKIAFVSNEFAQTVECDFIAGCDGYHGISKEYLPEGIKKVYDKNYGYGWLGILSNTKPISEELIYIKNKEGFALCSMRSKKRSRYYIQCDVNEKIENWSDDRFWSALVPRLPKELGNKLETGKSIEKSIALLRGFVVEPMRYKNLFLAGDSAHIVPPTGAKGLNLAFSDVNFLSKAFIDFYTNNSSLLLDKYSNDCLKRVWKTQRFSSWMTNILHKNVNQDKYFDQIQNAEISYLLSSSNAQMVLAENYLGYY